ncbi:putative lipase ROG1 [Cyberlindnera fabianii]|uniref:Putative lipase ROG1 n=1 Tax=Cyberlindnera fabianii TaxID=36022 RepID=A0A1V2L0Z2_CYBFA|nr:putative lipase ROG1 [Cyberlindnera fabianii]
MVQQIVRVASATEGSTNSPITPLSWPSFPSVPRRETIDQNLMYYTVGALGIGQVNRFNIRVHKPSDEAQLQSDNVGSFVWIYLKNSELDLLRPIYMTGPFTLYIDVTPYKYSHLEKSDEPIQYESDLKPGQSFKAKLYFTAESCIEDNLYGWTIDVISQLTLATAFHIDYTLAIGYDISLLKKATETNTPVSLIEVGMEDTHTLWTKPPPHTDKPVHLVILTHGIFSNIGADMLYIKDHIENISLHTEDFFKTIMPVNFIIMASPMLGITEFPKAVTFALDLGMLGATGRDLTLRHKFPSVMKKTKHGKDVDESTRRLTAKPILEQLTLPPAHQVFESFLSRTLYANAIHDGIVPLRTSALMFLDWRGLGDIEKLKKEYDENANAVAELQQVRTAEDKAANHPRRGTVSKIPEEKTEKTPGSNNKNQQVVVKAKNDKLTSGKEFKASGHSSGIAGLVKNPSSIFSEASKKQKRKKLKKYTRTQTIRPSSKKNAASSKEQTTLTSENTAIEDASTPAEEEEQGSTYTLSRSQSNASLEYHIPPVASTILTAANVIFSPEPSQEYLTDPRARPPSVFHDEVYTSESLPSPQHTKRRAFKEKFTRNKKTLQEQLARSWHDEMAWRKVLVTLKPDAHNNIAVRRKYVNAWGWGVVDHMVENHFGRDAVKRELDSVERFHAQRKSIK